MSLKHILSVIEKTFDAQHHWPWYERDEMYVPQVILPVHHNPRIARRAMNKLLPIGHRCRGDVGQWGTELVELVA